MSFGFFSNFESPKRARRETVFRHCLSEVTGETSLGSCGSCPPRSQANFPVTSKKTDIEPHKRHGKIDTQKSDTS